MIDKRIGSIAEALADVPDGAVVMVGGFGAVGQPDALLAGLAEQGARDLTIISNNAGTSAATGIPLLMALGRVRKVVCSFPRGAENLGELFQAGQIELELVPQGTLVERIRAAGAGIPGFFTPTGVGTSVATGKEVRTFNGRECLLELALQADLALCEAWQADRMGNLTYRGSGRNFNPIMAAAARMTVVQVHHFVELGQISPEAVVTPGIFVDRVVPLPKTGP